MEQFEDIVEKKRNKSILITYFFLVFGIMFDLLSTFIGLYFFSYKVSEANNLGVFWVFFLNILIIFLATIKMKKLNDQYWIMILFRICGVLRFIVGLINFYYILI